jgi:hypothetical protein
LKLKEGVSACFCILLRALEFKGESGGFPDLAPQAMKPLDRRVGNEEQGAFCSTQQKKKPGPKARLVIVIN